MQAKAHHSVGTLTDALADEVVIQIFNRAILCAELIVSRLPVFQILENLVLGVSFFFLCLGWLRISRLCHRASTTRWTILAIVVLGSQRCLLLAHLASSSLSKQVIALDSTTSLILWKLLVLERRLRASLYTLHVLWHDGPGVRQLVFVVLQVVHLDLSYVGAGDCTISPIRFHELLALGGNSHLPLLHVLLARVSDEVGNTQHLRLVHSVTGLPQQVLGHLLIELASSRVATLARLAIAISI